MSQTDIDIEAFRKELLESKAKILAEESLYEFLQQAWPYIEGANTPFIGGMHLKAICEHMEAVFRRDIRHLLINIPFRCSKSSIVSIAAVAWRWIHQPSEQFMYGSYSRGVSFKDSVKCRRLIQSPWYQKNWGYKYSIKKDQNAKEKFDNNKGGHRIATSVGASTTGFGANILILDDPNNAAHGEVQRDRAKEWYSSVWSTRLNDRKNDCTITIMQRIHEGDISGYILAQDYEGVVVHLMLPMEYVEKRKCSTVVLPSTNGKVWTDPRTEEGQLLWPERIDAKALAEIKASLSEYAISGQLQQSPSPDIGGILKRTYFKFWKSITPPRVEFILQSWDTALSDSPDACYSACTTWGLFYDDEGIGNVILLSMWRGRVRYPELRERAKRLYYNYRDTGPTKPDHLKPQFPDVCLVEEKTVGDPLIRDLRAAGMSLTAFNPKGLGDKRSRVDKIAHLLENGLVWLPAMPPNFDVLRPYAAEFLEEVIRFPNAESRDLVDTMTQAFHKLRDAKMLMHRQDQWEAPEIRRPQRVY